MQPSCACPSDPTPGPALLLVRVPWEQEHGHRDIWRGWPGCQLVDGSAGHEVGEGVGSWRPPGMLWP